MKKKGNGNVLMGCIKTILASLAMCCLFSPTLHAEKVIVFPKTKNCSVTVTASDGYSYASYSPASGNGWTAKVKESNNSATCTFTFKKPAKASVSIKFQKTDPEDPQSEITEDHTAKARAVKLKSITVTDKHGRTAKTNGALQLVLYKDETLTCKSKILPDGKVLPQKWPMWVFNKQKKYGKDVNYKKWRYLKPYKSKKIILKNVKPKRKPVFCEDKFTFIEAYPHNNPMKKYSTKKITQPLNKLTKWIKKWFSGATIKIGEGNIWFRNCWMEKKASPQAEWTYRARIKADPLITAKGDTITLQPKWLKKNHN